MKEKKETTSVLKKDKFNINHLISSYVKPAVGCTEPCAIGLATSAAFNAINGKIPLYLDQSRILENPKPANLKTVDNIKHIDLLLDNNVLKNALYVSIPGTQHNHGVDLAAVLGLFSNPDKELTLFETINESPDILLKKIQDKNLKGKIKIKQEEKPGLFIKATIKYDDNSTSEAIIRGSHSNIVSLKVNNTDIIKEILPNETNDLNLLELIELSMLEIVNKVETELSEETKNLLWQGILMNHNVAIKGVSKKYGDGIGYAHAQMGDLEGSMEAKLTTYLAGATDVRMSGEEVAVMSSVGSGNQGLIISVPLSVLAENYLNRTLAEFNPEQKEELIRTIALAHVFTAYSTVYTGMLSPLCGCTAKGGLGTSGAMAYFIYNYNNKNNIDLLQRNHVILNSIKNMIASTYGVLCDGAKGSCANKSKSAAFNAYSSAREANINTVGTGGIPGFEDTNIKKIMENFVETFIKTLGQPTDIHIVNYLLTSVC